MKKAELPRGLTLRGNSIIATFQWNGETQRRAVGKLEFTGINECQQRRLEFMRQVDIGTYTPPEARIKPVKPTVFTVADLWESYLRDYHNRGGKDSSRLEIGWNHLKPMFEKSCVVDVSTNDLNVYIEGRRGDGVQNATINREIALLKAMFRHGTRVTPPMVDRVPAFPKRLKESAPRKDFITDPQYAVLAANAKDLRLRALIACAYNFGFRKGELLNLRVDQVDLLDKWIELREGETKNGEARKVPMTSEVYELLRACVSGKKAGDYVFTREGGRRVVDPREEWYSLCVSSGLGQWITSKRKNGEEFKANRGLNLHDFRRSAIRNMTRRGVSETVAKRISGHKTDSVFRRYNIVDERDLKQAARQIEAGRQVPETGTKSDTSGFAESPDSGNSLN